MTSNGYYPHRNYAVGQRLATLRSRTSLTQAQLAEHLGVSRRSVQKWESGESAPSTGHLRELIALLAKAKAFTPGRERVEALDLWQQVGASAPQPFPELDQDWLDALLPARSVSPVGLEPRSEDSAARPVADAGVVTANIVRTAPVAALPIVGRETELAAIKSMLSSPDCRLLTLSGPPGVGKTRLALAAAALVATEFDSGVVFVDLAEFGTAQQLHAAIGEALQLSFVQSPNPAAHLLGWLRGRRILLALDGFEHLLSGVGFLRDILEYAPGVKLLVTSRERLNIKAEWLFDVASLAYPSTAVPGDEKTHDPAQPLTYSAVQLFVQRARQAQPTLALTLENLDSIAQITRQVEGLPLAIELAAASLRALPLDQIEREIRQNLAASLIPARDTPLRHRSLQAAFEHSWLLLSAAEQTAWSRLAVFRGGCSAEAAANITGAALPDLWALVDKSLLRHYRPPAERQQTPENRFSMTAPLRDYALQKLQARGEAEQFRRAHARYYLDLAEAAAARWDATNLAAAREQLELEYDNMRAALEWAQTAGDLDLGLRLSARLALFWRNSVHLSEGRVWLDRLLETAAMPVDLSVRLTAMREAAWLAFDQRDFARAERLFARAIALARNAGDATGERDLLFNAALQARASGQYNRALALLEDDRASQREADSLLLYARALLLREEGDFTRAQALLEECLCLARERGNRAGEAQGLLGLADIARDLGDSANTRLFSEQALSLSGEHGEWGSRGFALNNLAQAALLEGDLSGALRLAEGSAAVFAGPSSRASLAETLVTQGHILRSQGAAEGAYAAFSAALRMAWATGPRLFAVAALEGLARLLAPQEPGEVVRLLGATAAWRLRANAPLRPVDRAGVEGAAESARVALGDELFARNWEEAGATTLEQLLDTLPGREVFLASDQQEVEIVPLSQEQTGATSGPRLDWGDALVVAKFYGRSAELAQLQASLLEDGARVVGILGLGGIGKSALTTTLMQAVAPHFDAVIWRSVRDAPMVESLIEDYLGALAPEAASASSEGRLSLLLEQLRRRRVLLVLDNLETLLAEGVSGGQMRPGYEGYNHFLRELASTRHQSCLLFTSREKPGEIVALSSATTHTRTLRLAPLEEAACTDLLLAKGIAADDLQFEELSRQYGGNPLALNIVAQTILDLFDGELEPFLAEGAVIFGGVRDLLDRQFSRLSAIEQSVMFWLAILREPVTLDELLAVHVQAPSRARLLEAIEALRRRSLLEPGRQRGSFTLQSVVLEYVTARLVDELGVEIATRRPARLVEHGLELASSPDYVWQTQQRLLVAPLLAELRGSQGWRGSVADRLTPLLDLWRGGDDAAQGYGPANLLALLRHANGNLNGLDLSRLALRNVQLQGVVMQDTSLVGALLRDCTFTATFDSLATLVTSADGRFCAGLTTRGGLYTWTLAGAVWRELWHVLDSGDFACALGAAGEVVFSASWNGRVSSRSVRDGELLWSTPPAAEIGFVTSIAVAPNDKIVASNHADGQIHLWDGQSGKHLFSLPHPGPAPALAWSPDGQLLAASDVTGAIHLWALQQIGEPVCSHTLHEHSAIVTGLAFAPDNARLASCGWDGKVRLWNMPDGSLEQVIDGRAEKVSRIAWSADGRRLAFGGPDATVWLWDIAADRVQAALLGHTGAIRGLAFTTDNSALFSGSYDGTIRLWSAASGKLLSMMQSYAITRTSFAWSPDSASVAIAGVEPSVTIHPLDDTRQPIVLERRGERTMSMDWSPDGSRLALIGQSVATIELWNPQAGKLIQTLQTPTANGNYLKPLADWSPDGRFLACTSATLGVLVFDLASGSLLRPPEPLPVELTSGVLWSPDGTMLVSGDQSGVVYFWHAASGAMIRQLEGSRGQVQALEWSPEGDLLAVTTQSLDSEELSVIVWDVRRSEQVYTMPSGLSDTAVIWGASGHFMVGDKGGGLICWDIRSGEQIWQTPPTMPGWQWLKRSPDGSRIASSRDDGAVRIWDSHTGALLHTLRPTRPYERLNISGISGLNEAQKANLLALGALEVAIARE